MPDIVLTIEIPTSQQFLIYDAKYRSSRANILDAMSVAHIYHDSFRWGEVKTNRAILLALAINNVDWFLDEEFQSQEGVGVYMLTIGAGEKIFDLLDIFSM